MRVAEDGEDVVSHLDNIFGTIEADDLDGCVQLIEADTTIVNSTDKQKATPLIVAARLGRLDIVKYLIQSSNVDVNVSDMKGNTALHYACMQNHHDIVTFLLSCKVDLHTSNKDQLTPLHCAAKAGSLQTVQSLISENAEINCKERRHFTPLHFAAQSGQLAVVEFLLSTGADPHARTDRNKTPLSFAQVASVREAIEKSIIANPAPPGSDAEPPSAAVKKSVSKVCYAYQTNECQYGDKCRYLHVSEGDPIPTSMNEDVENIPLQKESKGSSRGNKVCFAWRRGECERGEACRFQHAELTPAIEQAVAVVDDEAPKNQKPKSSRKIIRSRVCFAFLRARCEDPECKFLHLNVKSLSHFDRLK